MNLVFFVFLEYSAIILIMYLKIASRSKMSWKNLWRKYLLNISLFYSVIFSLSGRTERNFDEESDSCRRIS